MIRSPPDPDSRQQVNNELSMRGVLLWAAGLPIPIIILLCLFHVI
jgi:hypothetical protein